MKPARTWYQRSLLRSSIGPDDSLHARGHHPGLFCHRCGKVAREWSTQRHDVQRCTTYNNNYVQNISRTAMISYRWSDGASGEKKYKNRKRSTIYTEKILFVGLKIYNIDRDIRKRRYTTTAAWATAAVKLILLKNRKQNIKK